MSKFLRKVDHKPFWEPDGEFSEYVPPGAAPADALGDLKTQENTLSVWQIDDDEKNLDRVLAAIASSWQYLLKIDFLIFDSKHIEELGLTLEKKDGQTHDSGANTGWHFDLIHLSALDLSHLANKLFEHSRRGRRTCDILTQLLKQSVSNGYVDSTKLHDNVRVKVLGEEKA